MNPNGEKPDAADLNPVYSFDDPAIVPPPGTMPPTRPASMARRPSTPGEIPGWEYGEAESAAVVPPPGTLGRERVRRVSLSVGIPETQPATAEAVTELLRVVQGVVDGPPDPAKLDALRQAAALIARAG